MKKVTQSLIIFSVVTLALTGCSATGTAAQAKEICQARFKLVDTDPNDLDGAKQWVDVWSTAVELKNSEAATEDETYVAVTMDKWFNATTQALDYGMSWPVLGTNWSDYGLELNTACQPFD